MSIEEMKILSETLNECINQDYTIQVLKEGKEDLSNKLGKVQKSYTELEREYDAINEDNNNLRAENADLHNEVTELKLKIQELKGEKK